MYGRYGVTIYYGVWRYISQSVTTTLLAGSSWTITLYRSSTSSISTVIISATLYFSLFCLLVVRQARNGLLFFSLRFSPLLLVVDLAENGPRC